MPQEKAYSSFNISGEGSTLPMITFEKYADNAMRQLFQCFFLFKKKYTPNIGLKKGSLAGKNYDKNENNEKFKKCMPKILTQTWEKFG